MNTHAQAGFAIKSWEEQTWQGQPADEISGAKLTRARVAYTYAGDINGESELQYLMAYSANGTGSFVGMERITGSVGGRSGSFVLQHSGTFDTAGVKARVVVVPGSGTNELETLRGEGSIDLAGQQPQYPISLDYELG